MAIFDNDPFGGTVDYSGYNSWQKVVTPEGQVFYEVPGFSGYVFDPVASNATGRKVFRPNPRLTIEEREKAKRDQEKLIKQQEFNQSPLGQLLPVGATVAGTVGAAHLMPVATSPLEQALASQIAQQTASQAAAQGAIGAPVAQATNAVATPQVLGANVVQQGTVPAQTGILANLGSMTGSLGGIGALGGIAAGTYLGGKAALDMFQGKKPDTAGRVVLGMATGGLSELANATGLFNHKSTRERQADVTNELQGRFKDDANYQNYVSGMREQFNSAPPDPSKPFLNGTYGSWDEYKQGGLVASDLTGVGGNIDVFKQGWTNADQATREKVTQALIDADLYYSEDGGVKIKDKKKAEEIFNSIVKPKSPAEAAANSAMGA
jgi:hypothetical protein